MGDGACAYVKGFCQIGSECFWINLVTVNNRKFQNYVKLEIFPSLILRGSTTLKCLKSFRGLVLCSLTGFYSSWKNSRTNKCCGGTKNGKVISLSLNKKNGNRKIAMKIATR